MPYLTSDADPGVAETAIPIETRVNGRDIKAEVEGNLLLIHFLRDQLGLTGSHIGCVVGRCGACTVVMDGEPIKSCMALAVWADDAEITTVEGLAPSTGLHPLQEAFWSADAAECGYCTPGMLMSAHALLSKTPDPSEEEIKAAISGNLCRCTGYLNIIDAVKQCAKSGDDKLATTAHDGAS